MKYTIEEYDRAVDAGQKSMHRYTASVQIDTNTVLHRLLELQEPNVKQAKTVLNKPTSTTSAKTVVTTPRKPRGKSKGKA